jgi:prevent-host-death family protein
MTDEPQRMGVREIRAVLPSVVDRAHDGERFVITVRGEDRCAVVSLDDLAALAVAKKPAKRRR